MKNKFQEKQFSKKGNSDPGINDGIHFEQERRIGDEEPQGEWVESFTFLPHMV